MSIAIVGMLDEREDALRIIKDCIEERGHKTCLIDISIGTGAIVPTLKPDVRCEELVALAGKKRRDVGGNTGIRHDGRSEGESDGPS